MAQGTGYRVAAPYAEHVSVQDYSPRPRIEGVRIVDLTLFLDDGGSFNELVRLRADATVEALPEFRVAQSSYSELQPGAIKAWHLHRAQDDLWFVPSSQRLLIGLLDVREGSKSCGVNMRFVMGGGRAQLLYIPAGVAHGAANPGPAAAAILYFTSAQFDPRQPDEQRLPWDTLGAEFWQPQPG
ncbi:MAG TPA: dTDP-4-dehydrorhamnose 3,5-epimerase family protein [Dehalococcoidia bacterium]|nr:dTDP-4-dehydrorhamnose 3,5-epimerase family protein [Dehalococcoidia bacterium]